MSQYTFGYTGTSQVANGGSLSWDITPQAGASTGNVAMPAVQNLLTYALTSVGGSESPVPPIPTTAVIAGIEMVIYPYAQFASAIVDVTAQLMKGATLLQNKARNQALGTVDGYPGSPVIYGSPTDLWGTTWAVSDIANIDWLYQVKNQTSSACHVYVDGLLITVYTLETGAGGGGVPVPHQLTPKMTVYPPDGKRFL